MECYYKGVGSLTYIFSLKFDEIKKVKKIYIPTDRSAMTLEKHNTSQIKITLN